MEIKVSHFKSFTTYPDGGLTAKTTVQCLSPTFAPFILVTMIFSFDPFVLKQTHNG